MLFVIIILSVAGNAKRSAIDAMLVVALSIYAYRFKVGFKQVIFGVSAVSLVVFVLSPLIHITRSAGANFTISERFEYTYGVIYRSNYDIGVINSINDRVAQGYQSSYRAFSSYVYPSTVNVDRFALILPMDQVLRVGGEPRVDAKELVSEIGQIVLPGALIEKTPGALSDVIGWNYSFRMPGVVSRPVVGLPASSVATGGFFGAIFTPMCLLFPLFIVLDKIGGGLRNSPWSVAICVSVALIPERTIEAIIGTMLREVPFILLVMAIIIQVIRARQRPTIVMRGA
jgi:hypothetical protein